MKQNDCPKSKSILPLILVGPVVALCVAWVYWRAPVENLVAKCGAEPQYQLGKCYYHGLGVRKSYAEAAKWFGLAAAQGHAKAETALGTMYAQGLGVAQNNHAALRMLRRAADQGFGEAENQLGILYAQGKGVPQDLDGAAKWFGKAADRGSQAARQNLKLLAATRPGYMASLTLPNGHTYRAVRVKKVDLEGITITFEMPQGGVGFARLAFRDMPEDLQQKYGYRPGATAQLANSTQLAAVVVQAL